MGDGKNYGFTSMVMVEGEWVSSMVVESEVWRL